MPPRIENVKPALPGLVPEFRLTATTLLPGRVLWKLLKVSTSPRPSVHEVNWSRVVFEEQVAAQTGAAVVKIRNAKPKIKRLGVVRAKLVFIAWTEFHVPRYPYKGIWYWHFHPVFLQWVRWRKVRS